MPDIPSQQIVARPSGVAARVRHAGYWLAQPIRVRRGVHFGYFAAYVALLATLTVVVVTRW